MSHWEELEEARKELKMALGKHKETALWLYNQVLVYSSKFTKSSLQYLLTLPKDEQVLILRNLSPDIDILWLETERLLSDVEVLTDYVEKLQKQADGGVSLEKISKPNNYLN